MEKNRIRKKVHVIAEAGTNHNGKLQNARELIDIAVTAKADSVKFQIINPDELYLPGIYKFGKYDINKVRSMRKEFMLTDIEYQCCAEYASKKRIEFSASVFDINGLDLLTSFNPPYIKIASTDLNNVRFLRKVVKKELPVILSTGMSSLCDIEHSVEQITREGFKDLILMHCVSSYPANLSEMNLSFIDVLRSAFGFPVGLSDHTQNSIAACMGVLKGVDYIEKHFTKDRNQDGFDHAYAAEDGEFIGYVQDIRDAEQASNPSRIKMGESELYVRKRARRSLYAARAMKAGELITDEDILVLRPQNEMAANEIDQLIGKKLRADISQYEPFSKQTI